tara:strand:+ start:28512 stop:29954 length:1443 start_codon:yes stop_codon:yes gene_type:complete
MYFFSKFKQWFLSEEEKNLFQKDLTIEKYNPKYFSIVQCPQQEMFFKGFKKLIENEHLTNFGGIHPRLGYPSFIWCILFFPNLLYRFHHSIIRKKWSKIYRSIGVDVFFQHRRLSPLLKISNFFKAVMFFFQLRCKKKLLKHSFKGILCGDLIYDSYIRFSRKATLNLADLTLIIYIQDCYNQICYFKDLVSNYEIKNYYSSYSTYITHGIPVRVFLKNGVQVYTLAHLNEESYNFKVKKLSINDFTQIKPHWTYKKIFKSLENKENLYRIGLTKLKDRFKGINDLDFMKENQFSPNYSSPSFRDEYDGVVFIGDFFDSQHIFRTMVFSDLFEWLTHTINLTIKYKLNIGFKPHPNQLDGSRKLINKITKSYPSINWIDPRVSNQLIFNSGIKFGVSVYGSVIPELAYHRIKPICCGDNPASDYNFSFQAHSEEEYDSFILDHQELKFSSNLEEQLGEFYYMNMFYMDLGYSKFHQKLFG